MSHSLCNLKLSNVRFVALKPRLLKSTKPSTAEQKNVKSRESRYFGYRELDPQDIVENY